MTEHVPIEQKIKWGLVKVCIPPLLLIGIIGNICFIWMFSQKELSIFSSSICFRALAICNLVILIKVSEPVFTLLKVNPIAANDTTCKVLTFIFSVAKSMSAWILILISLERLISIHYPFKVKKVCSRKNVYVYLCILFIAFSLTYMPMFFMYIAVDEYDPGLQRNIKDCYRTPAYKTVLSWLETIFYTILPFCILLGLNIRLAHWFYIRQRSVFGTDEHVLGQSGNVPQYSVPTKTLILTSLSYLVLTFPYSLHFIIEDNGDVSGIYNGFMLFRMIGFILFSINHCCNYLIFVLSARRLRELFIKKIRVKCVVDRVSDQLPKSEIID